MTSLQSDMYSKRQKFFVIAQYVPITVRFYFTRFFTSNLQFRTTDNTFYATKAEIIDVVVKLL